MVVFPSMRSKKVIVWLRVQKHCDEDTLGSFFSLAPSPYSKDCGRCRMGVSGMSHIRGCACAAGQGERFFASRVSMSPAKVSVSLSPSISSSLSLFPDSTTSF